MFASKDRRERQSPGPQRTIFAPSPSLVLLHFLLLGVTLLTVQAVLRRNLSSKHWLTSWELVTPSAGLSLLVGVATIIVVRRNVALGMRPILTYTGRRAENPTHLPKHTTVRLITLRNAGGGVALVGRCDFFLQWAGGQELSGPLAYAELMDAFRVRDPRLQESIWVAEITSGFALAADDTHIIAELAAPLLQACAVLDMRLRFSSLVEATFEKDVFLIPRQPKTSVLEAAPTVEDSAEVPHIGAAAVGED